MSIEPTKPITEPNAPTTWPTLCNHDLTFPVEVWDHLASVTSSGDEGLRGHHNYQCLLIVLPK